TRRSVCSKNTKHASLVVMIEMEKAIPGQNALKRLCQRQSAHIGDDPRVVRQAALAKRDHRRRRIDAGNFAPVCRQMTADRGTGTTTEIEDLRIFGQQGQKTIVPRLVVPYARSAVFVPSRGVPLIMTDYQIRKAVH